MNPSSAATIHIPLYQPEIRGNEWTYVKECLDTAWVSSAGPFVDRFERDLASAVSTKFAVATVNGTAALHTALLVAGVVPDDEVLVSTLTFIAPANTIRYAGAWPVFIDAEPQYWQMDPEKVIDFLTRNCEWRNDELRNKVTGRRVKAILPVHLLGHPVDFDPIYEIAQKYGLAVVEDATESLGAAYHGRPVGNLGEIAVFSFNGNKIITTGGGGMIVTNKETWARKARHLTTQAKLDPIEYVHDQVGYNYRLTNLQAAMGCAQLEQLPGFLARKEQIASRYAEGLAGIPGLTPMPQAPWARSTFWLYTVLIDAAQARIDSRELMRNLGNLGIQTRPLWQPLHLSGAFQDCDRFHCAVSERLYREALSLPSSAGLSNEDLDYVISSIEKALRDAG